jgi:hypothetical protein
VGVAAYLQNATRIIGPKNKATNASFSRNTVAKKARVAAGMRGR